MLKRYSKLIAITFCCLFVLNTAKARCVAPSHCVTLPSTLYDTINCRDSVTVGTHAYHLTGTYSDTLLTGFGCDSIVTLHLLAIGDTVNLFGGLCAGDSVYFYGTWIHSPGYYDTILPGTSACDTLAILTLVVQDPLPPTYLYDTICKGSSVSFNGGLVDTSGIYYGHFSNQHGCDSSVILTLTVLNPDTISITESICAGDTFRVGNITHTQAGNYSDTLTNAHGCDSVVMLALTVNPLPVVGFSWDSLATLNDVFYVRQDTAIWCLTPNQFVLIGGTPSSGHYFGNGISNDTLYGYQAFQYPYNNERDTIVYRYIDNNNCSGSAIGILIAVMCEGINEINADNSISIYPNPASTELYIKAENFRPEELILYNVSGQVIQSGKFEPHIDVNQLSSGVYFIEVKAGSEVARKRFVKM